MKRPCWILEFDYDFTEPKRIAEYIENKIVLEDMPLMQEKWPQVDFPCVAYGTMRRLIQMLRQPILCEAVFDHYPSLCCSYYYCSIYEFLGRNVVILPFSALVHIDLQKLFGDQVFIRPDSNSKPFEAEIVATNAIETFTQKYPTQQNELVVVSEVVELGQEYRCFCRNAKVVCHSSSPEPPYFPAPSEVIEFAEKVARQLARQLSSNVFTIDVAQSAEKIRLVEIGGVNSWGLYGADVGDFIAMMEAEALERQEDLYSF